MIDAALLAGLNHLLQGANWARERLGPFAGRQASFVMPPFALAFSVGADGFFSPVADPAAADVTVRLPDNTPFLLLQGFDKVMAAATVEGNAEFATELSFVLRQLRWDAEEDLSRLVGDIAAARLLRGTHSLVAWQQQALGNLSGNVAEYLVHEARTLIGNHEFSAFRDDLLRLNAALSALEKRSMVLQ
jgi:ubiquinone biosynthesis protein UbiJ